MSSGLGKVSLQHGNQNLTYLEGIRSWFLEHPTTTKVLRVATFGIGCGILASVPSAIPLGARTVVIRAVSGIAAIAISRLLPILRSPAFSIARVRSESRVVAKFDIEVLWQRLEQQTSVQLKGLEFLPMPTVAHRFTNIRCPKQTAISVKGEYLHANRVGVTQRVFVASQAPYVDHEIFWKAIFENNATIFDLTTLKDQTEGGVKKYYPSQVNQTVQYGSMSIELIEEDNGNCTYAINNGETLKKIYRHHCTDWTDGSATSLLILDRLVQQVEALCPNPKIMTWVHCRAGVGRTGTLITALILKEKIGRGEITEQNLEDSLVDIIVKLRQQRGENFVTVQDQLDLLYQYARSLLPFSQ